MRRKSLIGAGGEAYPTISTKKERASHGFVGYNVHPNREGRGRRAIMVELDGHSGLLVRAEQLSRSETAPSSGVVDRTQDASAAPKATIWSKAP